MIKVDVVKIERNTKKYLNIVIGAILIVVGIILLFPEILALIKMFIGFILIGVGFHLIWTNKMIKNLRFFRF